MSAVVVSERVQICGITFDDLDLEGVVEVIMDGVESGRGGWVVTPNVDIMRQAVADPELAGLIGRSTVVILDGAPLQWAGRIAGNGRVQRAPGASLALPLAEAAAQRQVPMLLLGGRPGAGEQAVTNLRSVLPELQVHDHCPDLGFESDPVQWDSVRDAVREVQGGIVIVGLGFPKQERVMDALATEFPDTWFLGLGGTIDFLGGIVSRAPTWIQNAGFEWVYRLAVEPRRLARRYLVEGLPFAWHLMVWAARERQQVVSAESGQRRVARRAAGVPAARPIPAIERAPHGLPLVRREGPGMASVRALSDSGNVAEVVDLRQHQIARGLSAADRSQFEDPAGDRPHLVVLTDPRNGSAASVIPIDESAHPATGS